MKFLLDRVYMMKTKTTLDFLIFKDNFFLQHSLNDISVSKSTQTLESNRKNIKYTIGY